MSPCCFVTRYIRVPDALVFPVVYSTVESDLFLQLEEVCAIAIPWFSVCRGSGLVYIVGEISLLFISFLSYQSLPRLQKFCLQNCWIIESVPDRKSVV